MRAGADEAPALRRICSWQLDADHRHRLRALLDEAFDHDFSDDDWDHALGGVHVVAERSGSLVGHASVVARSLVVDDAPARVGYVEAMAVAATARRTGCGHLVMSAVEDIIRAAYDFGALAATDDGAQLYQRRGWSVWEGPLGAIGVNGITPTPDASGSVMFWTHTGSPELHQSSASRLVADFRRGDPW